MSNAESAISALMPVAAAVRAQTRREKPPQNRLQLLEEYAAASPDTRLPAKVAAAGANYSEAYFELLRIKGGGPLFQKVGTARVGRVTYRKADVEQWLESRSKACRSTSEYVAANLGGHGNGPTVRSPKRTH